MSNQKIKRRIHSAALTRHRIIACSKALLCIPLQDHHQPIINLLFLKPNSPYNKLIPNRLQLLFSTYHPAISTTLGIPVRPTIFCQARDQFSSALQRPGCTLNSRYLSSKTLTAQCNSKWSYRHSIRTPLSSFPSTLLACDGSVRKAHAVKVCSCQFSHRDTSVSSPAHPRHSLVVDHIAHYYYVDPA